MLKIEQVGKALLPAIAYGDAAGLPFEGRRSVVEPHSVTGLRDITQNTYVGEQVAGTWSDDTHLSIAVSKALIKARGFNLDAQVDAHIQSWKFIDGQHNDPEWASPITSTEGGVAGWGGSTTKAVEALANGVSPAESGMDGGAGNGVLMKMAPLVLWQLGQSIPLGVSEQQLVQFTRMTHKAPEAVSSTLVHADMLLELLYPISSTTSLQDRLLSTINYAVEVDKEFDPECKTSSALKKLVPHIQAESLSRDVILEATAATNGFYAPDTLVMAYGSFLLEHAAPNSIYRGVELGGDADSIGSIIATMSLFNNGTFDKPSDYGKLFQAERLEEVSSQLATLVSK